MTLQIDPYDALTIGDMAGADTISYSGRGMYGDKCLGYMSDETDIKFNPMLIGVEAMKVLGYEDATRMARNMQTDSMGLGIVVYFPSVEYYEDDFDEDEDD